MTENEKRAYIEGRRSAWASLLRQCTGNLGYDDPEAQKVGWIIEREEAIVALRKLCDSFGDNDWTDTLHLSYIIEKHLARHLYRSDRRASKSQDRLQDNDS